MQNFSTGNWTQTMQCYIFLMYFFFFSFGCTVFKLCWNIWNVQSSSKHKMLLYRCGNKKQNTTHRNREKKSKVHTIPQQPSVHYASWSGSKTRSGLESMVRKLLTCQTWQKHSHCHWMCFMSNKKYALSEFLVVFQLLQRSLRIKHEIPPSSHPVSLFLLQLESAASFRMTSQSSFQSYCYWSTWFKH